MFEIEEILKKCIAGERRAQTMLVTHYAKKLLPICKRYAPDDHFAQDALQETFINTFKYMKKFSGKGSFDAWIRRIAVNCSLSLHKKSKFRYQEVSNETDYLLPPIGPEIYESMDSAELMDIIKELPNHYYMVFNLYIIEGYDHKEIGKMLGIGESTSRSNLSRARQKLKLILKKKQNLELNHKMAI